MSKRRLLLTLIAWISGLLGLCLLSAGLISLTRGALAPATRAVQLAQQDQVSDSAGALRLTPEPALVDQTPAVRLFSTTGSLPGSSSTPRPAPTPAPTLTPTRSIAYVTAAVLNVRMGPGTDHAIIAKTRQKV